MQRLFIAAICLLGACASGPPSRSDDSVARHEGAARDWRASGQLRTNQTAYDPVKDRFFIVTRDGYSGPITPRLFDVATGRITDLSFECPGRDANTGERGGPPQRWNGSDADFGKPDAGAVFLDGDRIAYNCPAFGLQYPGPTDGEDIALDMIFVDQPLSPGGAPRNTRTITRYTDPPWGATMMRALPGGGWITHRADNSTPDLNQTLPVIAAPGATQFETARLATDVCPPETPDNALGYRCRAYIIGGLPDGRLLAMLQVVRIPPGREGFFLDLAGYLLLRAEGLTLHVEGQIDSDDAFMNEALEGNGGWVAFSDMNVNRPETEQVAATVLHLWNPSRDARVRIYAPLTEDFDRYVIFDAAVSPSGQSVAIIAGHRDARHVFVIPIPQGRGYHMISLADAPVAKSIGPARDVRITQGGRVYTFSEDGLAYQGTVK